jgi:hypothetical protein
VTEAGPLEMQDRNWEIWRRRINNGETLASIGSDFGIGRSRVGQIAEKYQRKMRKMLRRGIFSGPDTYLRDEILGVEFVFSYKQDVPNGVESGRLYSPFYDELDHERLNLTIYDEGDAGVHWWVKQEEEQ